MDRKKEQRHAEVLESSVRKEKVLGSIPSSQHTMKNSEPHPGLWLMAETQSQIIKI